MTECSWRTTDSGVGVTEEEEATSAEAEAEAEGREGTGGAEDEEWRLKEMADRLQVCLRTA